MKSEMDKFAELLENEKIDFERFHDPIEVPTYTFPGKEKAELRNQIIIRDKMKKLSFICHIGSYGVEKGLIEFYDFKEEPVGYLTAEECLKIVKEELKK